MTKQAKEKSGLSALMSRSWLRFMVAGVLGAVVAFSLLLFMRFLVMGYDDSSTGTIMRYFTLKRLPQTIEPKEERFHIERPGDRPEISGLDDSDIVDVTETFPDDETIKIPAMSSLPQTIEKDIQLPNLNSEFVNEQDKMRQLKQAIIEGKE